MHHFATQFQQNTCPHGVLVGSVRDDRQSGHLLSDAPNSDFWPTTGLPLSSRSWSRPVTLTSFDEDSVLIDDHLDCAIVSHNQALPCIPICIRSSTPSSKYLGRLVIRVHHQPEQMSSVCWELEIAAYSTTLFPVDPWSK